MRPAGIGRHGLFAMSSGTDRLWFETQNCNSCIHIQSMVCKACVKLVLFAEVRANVVYIGLIIRRKPLVLQKHVLTMGTTMVLMSLAVNRKRVRPAPAMV